METQVLDVTPEQAREAYKLYRQHVNVAGSVDWEIEQIYRHIAKGSKVIQALESVRQAGFDPSGRPILAIVSADADWCGCRVEQERVSFWDASKRWRYSRKSGRGGVMGTINVELGPQQPGTTRRYGFGCRARVPIVPVHQRPKADLKNYHILWEADWSDVPVDPMLLRRIGDSDAWVVLAAWDLTPVERAVLRSRTRPTQ